MAQSICTSIAGGRGWAYAVQRNCRGIDTCTQICTSANLHNQDPQTQGIQWYAVAAIHVYALLCPWNSCQPPHWSEGVLFWQR